MNYQAFLEIISGYTYNKTVKKQPGNMLSVPPFIEAVNDYFFLLNRGYAEKPSLQLIGDRYRLSGNQRISLFRGITSGYHARNRKKKLTGNLKKQILHIDGYNVIFTIMNYLLGKTIFIANDGFLRDCGETHGKIEKEEIFSRSVDLLLDCISLYKPLRFSLYLDTTVENCENHKKMLEKEMLCRKAQGDIFLVKQADTKLKEIQKGILATSDSEIIDSTPCKIADMAWHSLNKAFNLIIPELKTLIKKKF